MTRRGANRVRMTTKSPTSDRRQELGRPEESAGNNRSTNDSLRNDRTHASENPTLVINIRTCVLYTFANGRSNIEECSVKLESLVVQNGKNIESPPAVSQVRVFSLNDCFAFFLLNACIRATNCPSVERGSRNSLLHFPAQDAPVESDFPIEITSQTCAEQLPNHSEDLQISFYFILATITSCHSAQHSVIHLTIYGSLEEHTPNGVWSIKLQYDHNFLSNRRVVLTFFVKSVASMFGCSSILSAPLWLSLLISSQTYDTYLDHDVECHW